MSKIETICPACDSPIQAKKYEINEKGIIDYWTCAFCGSDRVGCKQVEREGFSPRMIHIQLQGRERYRGINIDSYPLVISTYAAIEKHLKGED